MEDNVCGFRENLLDQQTRNATNCTEECVDDGQKANEVNSDEKHVLVDGKQDSITISMLMCEDAVQLDDLSDNKSHIGANVSGSSVLSFQNLSYKVNVRNKAAKSCCRPKVSQYIIKEASGLFRPGINAILGPTGSGKTTLLDILADRKNPEGLSGEVLVNGCRKPSNFKCMIGYVIQDDVVMGMLTVRENIEFSASLRLPSGTSAERRKEIVEEIISDLGLSKCANTKIGTEFQRGVSGGERKRANIAIELITSPAVLFLDEPTTGLDAFTAHSVMYLLKRLSLRGMTIILSIHQPRYSIFKLFDTMMLLSGGECVFYGPAKDALEYFRLGDYNCEEHNNPPDFFLDVLSGCIPSSNLLSNTSKESVEKCEESVDPSSYISNGINKNSDRDCFLFESKDCVTDIQDFLVKLYRSSKWHRKLEEDLLTIHTKKVLEVVASKRISYPTSVSTQIMSETNTHVAWPSKLKIGAKSKKDPHIKVSGHKDSVAEAKNRILAVLDTKSLRMTLKMDVSHTEHSHVIGKSGHNIKRVMQETGCHIHFPDSNRNTLAEKSNQVSVAGLCEGVELARGRIRELLPLVFMFEVPMTGLNQSNVDSNSAVIQSLQHHYGVNINIKTHHQIFTKTVIVRGSVYNSKSVQKATTMVFELLTGRVGEAFGVSMLLDIATQHHLFIIGHGGANINRIMQQTGATIHFPDPVTTEPQRRGTVCITGTMSSVFLARHQLLGCLPLVLMFDLKEDIEVDQGLLSQLMEQLDVFISIKPKPKQTAKSVIVKTIESNTRNVYEARRRILGLSQETPTFEMGFDVASSHSESLSDYQSRNKDMSSCFGLMTGIKNLQPFETHPTTIASSPLKNTGYGQMMMFANQHPKCHQSTPVYPPPFCYIPPCGFPDWRLYSPSHHQHRLHPTQMQHTLIPASFPAVPSQRSSAVNDNEDLGLQMGGSLPVPQMAPLSPSLTGVSSHNLRAVADSIPTLLHPHPSSTLPFTTSPLSLDFISSNAISSLSSEPALNSSQLDLFSNFFYGKSVLRNDTQHSLLRNHLDPTLTGLSCLQENISSGTFSSTPVFPSPRPYTVEAGYSHSSPLYSLQQSTSSASPAAMSSSSSSSAVPYHRPVHQQYAVHDGLFPTMPDKSNDVYPTTLITDSGLVDNSMAPVGYHSVNGSAYALGTKQHIDDERHDLLEDGRQTFPAQDVDLDVDRESDGSSEFGGSNKAPGSNRPKKSITECNLEGGSLLLSDIDYEQMKVLASKAMQKKPVGESRIPTDYWSGLGFSRSMPASAIRERLNLNNSNYDGPKMTAPYEDAEEDSEMWKTTLNSDNRTDDSGSLLDFVSQLSAQCRELSLQQDRRGIGQIDGRHQINSSSSSSSVWQPLSEKRTDGATVCIETDLSLLFGEMGLGKYAELFKQQEIDMQTFLTLTDQDLRDLGISTFGARRKMLLAIADFNKRQSLLPPPPGLSNPFQDAGNVRRHDIVSQSVRW